MDAWASGAGWSFGESSAPSWFDPALGAGRLSHAAVRARWVPGTAHAVLVGVLAFVASVVFLAILYCVIRLRVHPDE
jgi:hypothetical protein